VTAAVSATVPPRVRAFAAQLAEQPDSSFPAYVTDLAEIQLHAAHIRSALPERVELFYAAKAASEPPVLQVLDRIVHGIEVASGGELTHVRDVLPDCRLAFGGPGKTEDELELALKLGVERFHVESPHELRLLAETAMRLGGHARVLLRANLAVRLDGAALTMGGEPTAFGMDPAALDGCIELLLAAPPAVRDAVQVYGVHAHLASGLDARALLTVAEQVTGWAAAWARQSGLALAEVNVGGGMAVDYGDPGALFDWTAYGAGLAELLDRFPGLLLRVEPGRSVTAYGGYYVTRVLDVKRSYGSAVAVLQGGTHHLRTPAAKGHDHPFTVLPVESWDRPWPRPAVRECRVTLAGQLCTPRDVLARSVPLAQLRAGDVIVFAMAGAYAWNISHHDFLMHPAPSFHYLPEIDADL
jgi:diaminopimelate decarboxylase